MKEELVSILPKTLLEFLGGKGKEIEGKTYLDFVLEDALGYDFRPEEIVPCLHAAYYAYQATVSPEQWDNKEMLADVFVVGYRSAFKLLSYGKYKATRTDSGWMRYEK